ncbi:MAG: alpha/beta fold hydrolase, partial [Solirubrobacteraceae bacterium]
MKRATRILSIALAAGALAAPAASAADPQMHFDGAMKVENVCFNATKPGDSAPSQIFGERFTDGPVSPSTPVIVLVHGIASSTETWDFSPTWSVARAFASMGYVVISYDRLGYKRSVYSQPGGGYSLTTTAQRNVLHQMIGA